jgi:hypothetical protein
LDTLGQVKKALKKVALFQGFLRELREDLSELKTSLESPQKHASRNDAEGNDDASTIGSERDRERGSDRGDATHPRIAQ